MVGVVSVVNVGSGCKKWLECVVVIHMVIVVVIAAAQVNWYTEGLNM